MTQEVEKITRHQAPDGTIFQVRHFFQSKVHNVLAEFARVFKERVSDKGEPLPPVFCGGDPHRILALPELKEDEPKPQPEPQPEPAPKAKLKAVPAETALAETAKK